MRSKKYKSKTGQTARSMMPFSMQRQKKRPSPRNEKATFSLLKGLKAKKSGGQTDFFSSAVKNLVHHNMNDVSNRAEGSISFICLCQISQILG